MRLVIDENLSPVIATLLRNYGHDVIAVAEESPRLPDPAVMEWAVREDRIPATSDNDFGALSPDLPSGLTVASGSGSVWHSKFVRPRTDRVCGRYLARGARLGGLLLGGGNRRNTPAPVATLRRQKGRIMIRPLHADHHCPGIYSFQKRSSVQRQPAAVTISRLASIMPGWPQPYMRVSSRLRSNFLR